MDKHPPLQGLQTALKASMSTIIVLISLMIQQNQTAKTLQELISNLVKTNSSSIKLHSYQQIIELLQNSNGSELIDHSVYLITHSPAQILSVVVDLIIQKFTLQNNTQFLFDTLLSCFQERLQSDSFQRKKILMESLMMSKSNLLQALFTRCAQSRERACKILNAANEMLNDKLNKEQIINMNFTFTTALAFRIIQSPSSNKLLQQQAIRHLLITDLIHKGQICQLIAANDILLDSLIKIGRKGQINPYWLVIVTNLTQISDMELDLSKIYQLEEQGLALIKQSVEPGKDLTEEIYNILQSDKTDEDKRQTIQVIRAICMFASNYVLRSLKGDQIDGELVSLLQQLMGIKDFIAFEFIVRAYAHIIQLESRKQSKLSKQIISKIQRNCLPKYIKKITELQEYDTAKLSFFANNFESLVDYSVSAESAQAMKVLSDKILGERGCLPKAVICSCYDSYIHTTIEAQYDQEFNQHQFMSVTHLICRQITRVCELNPSQVQLQTLKEYLMNNIKWLLNLNQSCLPQNRRCINFKTLDVILSFPYILKNNQFLQQVTFDLLLDRMPHTFHHLHTIINFYKSQSPSQQLQTKLDSATQKLIEKAKIQGWSLKQKICIWELVMYINDNNDKLGEILQVYSLHEDHWIAKYCAALLRKIKLPESVEVKILQIIDKMQKKKLFFKNELKSIEMCSK